MSVDLKAIFDNFGTKIVTHTDRNKGAYVPTAAQRVAIAQAGINPAVTRPAPGFPITVLFEKSRTSVSSSYYHSERSTEAKRSPEPRMGHEIISSWLNEGDEVVIGNIGPQLFAYKVSAFQASEEANVNQEITKRESEEHNVIQEITKRASSETIISRAKKAKGQPPRRTVQRDDFVRNPYVVAAAIIRSNGACETPGCKCPLFFKEDGAPYLEVHHIQPLSKNGEDMLENVAAICPHCHRELHFGKEKDAKLVALKSKIASLPAM